MSCSFSVTRVCRARIVVITESRRGFKPGHWRETAARRRRAGGVHRRVPKRRLHHRLDARLPRTLAGLLAGGALGLAGALMQTLTRNPLADPGFWALTTAPASPLYWARRCLVSPRRWSSFSWHLAARLSHR